MPAYTGPIPPTPTATSPDAAWQSWWNYQSVLRDLRYEDERAARALALDKQHADKMVAETACAAATKALADANIIAAAAQKLLAENLLIPTPAPRVTDEQLVQSMLPELLSAGLSAAAAMDRARQSVALIRFFFKVPA